jgi:cytochrome c biogenesis protein CcmG, thiol:disulfide interchange protein DsbE
MKNAMRNLATLVAAGLLACAAAQKPPRAAASIGRPVALDAPDLAGRTVDVAADRGKVRVVAFWATWCEPCREELPALDRLQRELGPRGLSVYAVSFDEDPAQIPPFLAQVPVDFPVLWDKGGDRHAEAFLVDRLPTALIVDRAGLVRFVHQGYDESEAREERREVEMLLAEPPP